MGGAGADGRITETPDLEGAYPRLDDAQLAALDRLGQRRQAAPGEVLVQEGDRECAFFVILAGHVSVIDGRGTSDERVIGVHGRGRFLGELGLLTGEGPFYTAMAADSGEVLAMPAGRLRELVSQDPSLGDLILRAYLIRRSLLIGLGGGVRVVGSRYSPDARRVREFMARNRIPARWLDLEADPAADALLAQFGVAPEETPLLIVHGQLLRNPGNAQLAAAVGLPVPSAPHSSCDLLVVGAGPAGLSAAVYGASEGMRVIILDAIATGGQAGASSRIENYLGFPSGISGAELAERAVLQARKFGAQFAVPAEAKSIRRKDFDYVVQLQDGTSVTAESVVVATGCMYRRLNVPHRDHFEKTSIYYAASQAEAPVCDGVRVVVVGGGNSAGQAAVFLSRRAARVTMVVRERELDEYMSRYLIDQLERTPNVDVILGAEVRELLGGQALEGVVAEDRRTGARHTLEAAALFVFVGVAPCTGWLGDLVELDDDGFVRTGSDAVLAHGASPESVDDWRHLTLETSEPGVFAVGDVRSGSARRVAAAVGEGAMAIRLAMERNRSTLGRNRSTLRVFPESPAERSPPVSPWYEA
jgi:thioredoxin reductase (NADPH)